MLQLVNIWPYSIDANQFRTPEHVGERRLNRIRGRAFNEQDPARDLIVSAPCLLGASPAADSKIGAADMRGDDSRSVQHVRQELPKRRQDFGVMLLVAVEARRSDDAAGADASGDQHVAE